MKIANSEEIRILNGQIKALRSQAFAATSFNVKRALIKKIIRYRKALQDIKDRKEYPLYRNDLWRSKESLTAIPLKNY